MVSALFLYIFRIRRDLGSCVEGWNQQRLRPVHGKSPLQLYKSGVLQNRNRGQRGGSH